MKIAHVLSSFHVLRSSTTSAFPPSLEKRTLRLFEGGFSQPLFFKTSSEVSLAFFFPSSTPWGVSASALLSPECSVNVLSPTVSEPAADVSTFLSEEERNLLPSASVSASASVDASRSVFVVRLSTAGGGLKVLVSRCFDAFFCSSRKRWLQLLQRCEASSRLLFSSPNGQNGLGPFAAVGIGRQVFFRRALIPQVLLQLEFAHLWGMASDTDGVEAKEFRSCLCLRSQHSPQTTISETTTFSPNL
mmetsp:Transcript_55051/g.125254  ORF Transcript_55051/g.125254 Transcript_55051/m.125254 type:complete len:246 (-) Transcript_55051:145-882(-)